MELTRNHAAIPPRTIGPSEAARLLMGKHHLAFLGVSDIAKHQWLFNELIIALPGQCAVLCIQASWQWTPDKVQKCIIFPTTDRGERSFTIMFVPDSIEGRLAMIGTLLVSGERLSAILSRRNVDAPILMLDDPRHPGNQALFDGYATVCSALQMIFAGKAIDTSLN